MNKEPQLKRFTSLRYSNTKGNIIPMHHAFLTVQMPGSARITAFVLPLIFLALIWLFLPVIIAGWGGILAFWTDRIYSGNIGHEEARILGRHLTIPYPMLDAETPSSSMVYWNLVICAVAFVLSFLMPSRIAPLTYLTRAALLIQSTASIDRLISPDFFPYTLKLYMTDTLSLCVYLVFLLPAVLGFVYYIFDFGLWRKLVLTILMLAYYFIAIPCQYMLHAVIIHEGTLLFLPLMYLLFGTLLDVLMFVSIYAFGMSWRSSLKSMQGRGL